MTVTDTIAAFENAGGSLRLESGEVKVRYPEGRREVVSGLLAMLRQDREGVARLLRERMTVQSTVRARVRGQDAVTEAASVEICWHCAGKKACHCALCAIASPGTGWGEGVCRACLGSGHLTWPEGIN